MKLYAFPFSSNARKAVMTASLLDLQPEIVIVDLTKGEQKTPAFLALNPNGKVPVLVDGDLVLWESNAIMAYMADKKPGNTLYPQELRARADVNRWLFWAASHWNPAIAMIAFENVLKKRMGLGEPDPVQVGRGEAFLSDLAVVLDKHLASHEWVCGQALTIADLAIAAPLMYSVPARLPIEPYANIQRWNGQIQELEAWKSTSPW